MDVNTGSESEFDGAQSGLIGFPWNGRDPDVAYLNDMFEMFLKTCSNMSFK